MTLVRKHRRRKKSGGFTTVKEHIRSNKKSRSVPHSSFYDKMSREEYEVARQKRIREIKSIKDPVKRMKLIDKTYDDASIYILDRDGRIVIDNSRWLFNLEYQTKQELDGG